jgi:hypothetical protein
MRNLISPKGRYKGQIVCYLAPLHSSLSGEIRSAMGRMMQWHDVGLSDDECKVFPPTHRDVSLV